MLSSDHWNDILAPVPFTESGRFFVGQNVFSMTVFFFTDYVTLRWGLQGGGQIGLLRGNPGGAG